MKKGIKIISIFSLTLLSILQVSHAGWLSKILNLDRVKRLKNAKESRKSQELIENQHFNLSDHINMISDDISRNLHRLQKADSDLKRALQAKLESERLYEAAKKRILDKQLDRTAVAKELKDAQNDYMMKQKLAEKAASKRDIIYDDVDELNVSDDHATLLNNDFQEKMSKKIREARERLEKEAKKAKEDMQIEETKMSKKVINDAFFALNKAKKELKVSIAHFEVAYFKFMNDIKHYELIQDLTNPFHDSILLDDISDAMDQNLFFDNDPLIEYIEIETDIGDVVSDMLDFEINDTIITD